MNKAKSIHCVVLTDHNWSVVELVETGWIEIFRVKDGERTVKKASIVAVFQTAEAATEALNRAQALEKQLRPLWQIAVSHELQMFNAMIAAVRAELRQGL